MAKNRGKREGSTFRKWVGLSPRMFTGLALGGLAVVAIPAVGETVAHIATKVMGTKDAAGNPTKAAQVEAFFKALKEAK